MLRWFGFVRINYGYATGRHWVSIDGNVIAQTTGNDLWMADPDVCDLARCLFADCEWKRPTRLTERGHILRDDDHVKSKRNSNAE